MPRFPLHRLTDTAKLLRRKAGMAPLEAREMAAIMDGRSQGDVTIRDERGRVIPRPMIPAEDILREETE